MDNTNKYQQLPDVLDVSDIKNFLNIGRVQAYELVNSGQFHVIRLNRRIKVPKSAFIKWFEGK
ncbi:helix-turn-helix domain-containing protein [Niallia sp. Sow4_A1]|uniref:helix-turn-helix domain-containing protein n=1 Tax=unclassified Niallia TaxID=2837522 RepID=UPI00203F8CEF|nr:helix-turn-helix domain-containing protein [Niallia sp. MER TA 168]MCM3364739.1 helix-turn-helix domain-containing protein [Niallia sp. MER TA 168]